ncbi:oxysterol-binding protein-related protein 3-like [Tigriopus californicus]|uniref:oxysterol-binding protein-related protein 3-like n=1 Tax=Tigriopus californicus TaxID=6832 RepID=UPI0027D9F826|nr:oxysterol-binding protein-related protein 3-like [Tigriopus californicus]
MSSSSSVGTDTGVLPPHPPLATATTQAATYGGAKSASSTQPRAGNRGEIRRKGSEWEMLGSVEGPPHTSPEHPPVRPIKHQGYLLKKRKWPMKGWHKRYFVLDHGVLTYAKTPNDLTRGRTHGRIDVGSAVITAKAEAKRIDLDDEECHHIKVSNMEEFGLWSEQLKQHRMYSQQRMMTSVATSPLSPEVGEAGGGAAGSFVSPRGSLPRNMRPNTTINSRNPLLNELNALEESMTTQLLNIQHQSVALAMLAHKIEDEQNSAVGQSGGKHKKLFGLRKKKSAVKSTSTDPSTGSFASRSSTLTSEKQMSPVQPEEGNLDNFSNSGSSSSTLANMSMMSTSNPSLAGELGKTGGTSERPVSFPAETLGSMKAPGKLGSGPPILVPTTVIMPTQLPTELSAQNREEILCLAQEIQSDVSNLLRSFSADKDRLKSAMETTLYEMNASKAATIGGAGTGTAGNMAMISSLRQSLNQALQQNSTLRAKLQKIHLDSDVGDLAPIAPSSLVDTLPRGMNHSLSYSSSCISEFFDAREYGSDLEYSSDDDDDEASTCSENTSLSDDDEEVYEEARSPPAALSATSITSLSLAESASTLTQMTGRRQTLPVPKSETEGLNLWNLLCKNIGKDLSKISMPVTLNEPLSALQRLCEELEYSELLDKAADASDPVERMTWVAAFAVSGYGSVQARAGHKPFNPLLGETFECVREDLGFRYVAEQVSHHPPVAACHASALNNQWSWFQDLRVKTKFWGKSMEFQPLGKVNVELKVGNQSESYEFNKITTCIHNLFGGAERWVDLYGECVIKSSSLVCKIDFVKASYWSNKRHEIFGTITNTDGKVLQHLFGKWSEALYCGKAPSARCIWRPAILPADSQLYYGFSQFAIQLNELLGNEKDLLPPTDTRFRPDQRMLEIGQIPEAENLKLSLEQNQRDRRHEMEEKGQVHEPKWFTCPEDRWVFNGQYWDLREKRLLKSISTQQLW